MPRVLIVYEPRFYAGLLARLFEPYAPSIELVHDIEAGVDVVIFPLGDDGQPRLDLLPPGLPEAKLISFSPTGERARVRLPGQAHWRQMSAFGLSHLINEVMATQPVSPPASTASAQTALAEPGADAPKPQGKRRPTALVVEDDEDLLELLDYVLTQCGLTVVCSTDGRTALQHMEQIEPDVVVLDIMLPDISGWAVYERIRRKSDVPIMMITALVDAANRQRGQSWGAADYMTKPFLPSELAQRVLSIVQ